MCIRDSVCIPYCTWIYKLRSHDRYQCHILYDDLIPDIRDHVCTFNHRRIYRHSLHHEQKGKLKLALFYHVSIFKKLTDRSVQKTRFICELFLYRFLIASFAAFWQETSMISLKYSLDKKHI